MINILFGFFLFGMLCFLCARFFYLAAKKEQPLTIQNFALLAALAIGSLIALSLGLDRMGYPPLYF